MHILSMEAGTKAARGCWAALSLAVLAACNAGQGGQSSQVVAEVNGSEITISQLSEALQAAGRTEENPTPEVTKQAIDALIDEQLLVDQALKMKLDRDPAVVQAIERARRQVLAQAYAERVVYPQEPISAAEQIEYYKKHPELFERRRIYQVAAFSVQEKDLTDAVRGELDKVKSADEVRNVLDTHKVSYDVQKLTRAAEQLPLDAVSGFARANVGDLVIMSSGDGQASMMLIEAIHDSPIDLGRAQPLIQQYLVNVRNSQAMKEYLAQARSTADIKYFTRVSDAAPAGDVATAGNGATTAAN